MPHPSLLTAHRPPALLVEELLEASPAGDAGRTRLAEVGEFLQLCEGCAQSIAVLMGGQGRRAGGAGPARGRLVGVQDAVLLAPLSGRGGAPCVSLVRIHELPPYALWQAEVHETDGRAILRVACSILALPADAGAAESTPSQQLTRAGLMDPLADADCALSPPHCTGDSAEALACFAADAAVFTGHFPGDPLLPGVHQIALVVQMLRRALAQPTLALRGIERCKWLRPLRPGAPLGVSAAWRAEAAEWLVDAGVRSETEDPACRMRLRVG